MRGRGWIKFHWKVDTSVEGLQIDDAEHIASLKACLRYVEGSMPLVLRIRRTAAKRLLSRMSPEGIMKIASRLSGGGG